MSDTTKEKIKKTALSLFAQKGYDGATMNDIAKQVGIKAPSLYAHFDGKKELYFSVYEDLVKDYVELLDRIIEDAKHLEVEEKLFHIFEQYVVYFIRNPEVKSFWNQITLFTPPELDERFYSHIKEPFSRGQNKLEAIFTQEIARGKLREDSPVKMTWSLRIMMGGILYWMIAYPELKNEESIRAFWDDLWLGLKKR